jgi:hypothetical protein
MFILLPLGGGLTNGRWRRRGECCFGSARFTIGGSYNAMKIIVTVI